MNEFKYKEYKTYNPKLHDNHCKSWTTQEIRIVKESTESLAWLSNMLGRTISSIRRIRRLYGGSGNEAKRK
ncbi:MAG: hypothetical protein ACRCX2_03715 [Paraclostridium sp.]